MKPSISGTVISIETKEKSTDIYLNDADGGMIHIKLNEPSAKSFVYKLRKQLSNESGIFENVVNKKLAGKKFEFVIDEEL